MFRRILIANRGEVAARVLATCRRLGIEAVAVTTDVDRELSWLAEAHELVEIGGRRAYLDADALIGAAVSTRCSAVHPGWGFLSENPTFAARCEAERLTFIGPDPASMRRMSDKAEARRTMAALGLAPIPGSLGPLADLEDARAEAARIGAPVLLKALAGGGGRGMRAVHDLAELEAAWNEAAIEAASAFGDPRLYLEKLITDGRHIELQILGDGRGGVVVLGERECSVQRRHQKLIEESPSPVVGEAQRQALSAQVSAAVGALRYRGAGTIEMLRDPEGAIWFMEMNTRLQVEHTVTEACTGVDLVEWQLKVAANQPLHLEVQPEGHAIECRINAEDPADGFRPCPGRLDLLQLPEGEGIRVDTHLRQGDRISPHYDSMFAKIIAHAPTRDEAIARMQAALANTRVEGVKTTIQLHQAVLAHPRFRSGEYDTGFLEQSGILGGGLS